MKKTSYELIDRLDLTLNSIVQNPGVDKPEIGYSALEREVNVRIEAPELKAPIQGAQELGDGWYSGRLSVDYLKELAYREDIVHLHSVSKQQTR